MSKVSKLILGFIFCFHIANSQQGQNYLKSEYDPDIDNLCSHFRKQMAMDYNVSKKNLQDIFQSLNFSSYNIEVIECTNIYSSALAYLNKNDNKRYVLINLEKLNYINTRYYSHLFVIAHEFSHFYLNHFSNNSIPTQSELRKMELEADQNAATIVKRLGGTNNDCKYALDLMNHPVDDTYADHPTKVKRYQAVDRGFLSNIDLGPAKHSYYVDYLRDFSDIALLKYDDKLKNYDLSYYYSQSKMFPEALIHFKNKYFVFWKKLPDVTNYSVFWDYDDYPSADIQKRFDEGYNIEFLEKIDNKWYIVMLKYNNSFYQKTRFISKSDFLNKTGDYDDNVKNILDAGYSIQNLVDNGNQFLIVYTKFGSNGSYSYTLTHDYSDFKTWYQARISDGYNYMYCFKYINNSYFGFMQPKSGVNTWKMLRFDGNDANEIVNSLNNDFTIDNVTVDNNYIRITCTKY